MDYSSKRKDFVDWVRNCLMGPGSQDNILRGIHPAHRYHVGVLFPVIKGEEGIDPASEDEADVFSGPSNDDEGKPGAEPARKKRRYIPPSSVGFSFFIQGDHVELQIIASAVKYFQNNRRDDSGKFIKREWRREKIPSNKEQVITLTAPKNHKPTAERYSVFDGQAEIYSFFRPHATGWIVTVSLCNTEEVFFETPLQWECELNERSLFEARLNCIINSGHVGNYPRVSKALLSAEEQEIELQYKTKHIYAVGHGAGADWELDEDGRVMEIRADFMPTVEVPQVTADVADADSDILKMEYLSECKGGTTKIFDDLEMFVTTYGKWVTDQICLADLLVEDDYEKNAAERIIRRMQITVTRMRQGVLMLRSSSIAARAFGIANRAIFDQMAQYDNSKGQNKPRCQYRWRPFQLGFLLMVIDSVINEDSEFRDIVDLIWFPTGGGKTEAYLGLIAFQIVWRRLTNPSSGGGTTVIMRYTLRLLTAQQYQRATRLICALELIRRKESDLGIEQITIGMWVGEAASPNTFAEARSIVSQSAQAKGIPPLKLILNSCPWCLTPFKSPSNYDATSSSFNFRCTEPTCHFGQTSDGTLPCNVVDEALYNSPPTLLLSTVDKFARITWDDRTSGFFGINGNRPPELIIQDELHLISGALGSIAGLYEAALDTILIRRGVHPKYIASTATIRMAEIQVRRLYGRELAVFPPPGLSSDDSFFSRTVPTHIRPGRLYVGFLGFMLDRRHCMAPLSAALLAAPEIVFESGQIDRDAYLEAWWTQVVYHGSLRGVGMSHNAFNIHVRDYFNRYVEEALKSENRDRPDESIDVEFHNEVRSRPNVAQITSLSTAEENAHTFTLLGSIRGEAGCIDAVLATNMISVGLDVARLSLMIINGQPLTTAEYIQASSRVGRSEVPGIIFINYYRDQARSLSHYENFRPYHESFYRFVEPTSITPYTYQARLRALHAALVISIRHSCDFLLSNKAAGAFDSMNGHVRKVIETLKHRCSTADNERGPEATAHIDRLVSEWQSEVERCKKAKIQLDYLAPDKDKATERLLYKHDDKIKGLWPTLQSMRNVENSALIKAL